MMSILASGGMSLSFNSNGTLAPGVAAEVFSIQARSALGVQVQPSAHDIPFLLGQHLGPECIQPGQGLSFRYSLTVHPLDWHARFELGPL